VKTGKLPGCAQNYMPHWKLCSLVIGKSRWCEHLLCKTISTILFNQFYFLTKHVIKLFYRYCKNIFLPKHSIRVYLLNSTVTQSKKNWQVTKSA